MDHMLLPGPVTKGFWKRKLPLENFSGGVVSDETQGSGKKEGKRSTNMFLNWILQKGESILLSY